MEIINTALPSFVKLSDYPCLESYKRDSIHIDPINTALRAIVSEKKEGGKLTAPEAKKMLAYFYKEAPNKHYAFGSLFHDVERNLSSYCANKGIKITDGARREFSFCHMKIASYY